MGLMSGVYLLIGTFFLLAVILVTVVLVVIQKHKMKVIRREVEELDKEKNIIASTPVLSELSKVESIIKNEKMEEKYKNWQRRFEVIKEDKINRINDMLIDLDVSVNSKDYRNWNQRLARTEMEIYKVRESASELLNEIKEITLSEEKYRSIITKLKAKYRKLMNEFNTHKGDYEDLADVIELQFENIEKRFLDFESIMEKNEYDEVSHIVKALDTMIDHMSIIILEAPNLVLLAEKLIPKRIAEILSVHSSMTEKGYNLEYLNIEYNMEESIKNISNILDRIRVLNFEDCMFELKTLVDYLDKIFNDFDNEKLSRRTYEELLVSFSKRIKKTSKAVKTICSQMNDIKTMYDLSSDDFSQIIDIEQRINKIVADYKVLLKDHQENTKPYSYLNKQLEAYINLLKELESDLDESIKSLGSMQDDEVRAREQLEEISDLLNQCKSKIRSYKLPIIMNNYFVELSEANDAINEIVNELAKKPIIIKVLNMRVDTARDLVLKLFNTTNDMIKTAQLTEMAIVYGNRYRSESRELDKGLENAEMLYHKGSYKDALEVTLSSIEIVESDIHEKLLNVYNGEG